MTNTCIFRGLVTFVSLVVMALLAAAINVPAQTQPSAEQATSDRIKVNGKFVPPGFAIATNSVVESGPKSSAVVSLGKLGRVEVLPSSKMKITFDDTHITVALSSGGARVFKAEGATASVTTKDGEVSASTPLAGSFTVDTECGDSVVTANEISVELRLHGETRTLLPGARSTAGVARANCKPTRRRRP